MKKKTMKKKAFKKKAETISSPAKKKRVVKDQVATLDNPFPVLTDYTEPGKFIVIHSPPGEGKTTIAGHAPDPLFIFTSDEQGIKQALHAKVVPPSVKDYLVELDPVCPLGEIPKDTGHLGWIKCIDTLIAFETQEHDRRTLVIDSTSGLQSLCHQHTASMLFDGDMVDEGGFMNFYKGYIKAAEQYWQREFLATLSRIVAKGYNVILLAHTKLQTEPNPAGPETKMYTPDLDARIWGFTKKAVQGTLFLGKDRNYRKDKSTKKTVVSSEERFVGVNNTTWYEAKNWFDLQDNIEAGSSAKETWNNIATALEVT
jgi:hypothetical protein